MHTCTVVYNQSLSGTIQKSTKFNRVVCARKDAYVVVFRKKKTKTYEAWVFYESQSKRWLLTIWMKLCKAANISPSTLPSYKGQPLKVIRHVFGFGIEFLENKDIGIFGHFIAIGFVKRYSYHTYFAPISTSWFRRFGTRCIVSNGEWRIFVNYSVLSALFPLKLSILFEECILGTPVQKDAIPPIFISHYHRSKPSSTTTDLCMSYLSLLLT